MEYNNNIIKSVLAGGSASALISINEQGGDPESG